MKKIIVAISLVLVNFAYSQERKVAKANEEYNNYAYIDAIKIYEKVAEKGYSDPEMFKKIGNSYYFNAELEKAGRWYAKLFEITSDVEPEYFYRYSQCLKNLEDYALANEYLDKFSKASSDSRGLRYTQNKEYLGGIQKTSQRYKIEDAGINTEYSDYGGSFYEDKFVFTTARDTGGVAKVVHKWTNQAFSKLYTATLTSEGFLVDPELFSKNLTSKFNESTAVFTKDGNTVYFTRNNYLKGKKGTNSEDIVLLKLYKATKVDGDWKNIEELPFNSNEYNTAHPALSPDDKTLYFASDMPGTIGLSDIFKVTINPDGSFGTPVNLGDQVNTEGRETFPFVSDSNEFYFASDGHLGLGGLDIFAFKINDDNSFTNILNVGSPVNSPFDDFCYSINNETRAGFFSSNRDGGKGYDDIYKFKEEIPLVFNAKQSIEGLVIEDETQKVIPNASVILFDENMNQIGTTFTDENGNYHFDNLNSETKYYIRVQSSDYEVKELGIITDKGNGKTYVKIPFTKKVQKVKVGSDLAKAFKIEIIYFDLDKSNIRPDAAVDLAKIVEVLKENPTMKIEVRSHTDSRQTEEYNLKLSERRSKSTMKWMVKNGISPDRITAKGFGESQLVNGCKDGVDCTEEQHQANRRSEFVITAL
ncbi:OmpA family protein [Flavobacterium sp. NRK F10]|uniref:OmpA family protein n=1 Tax=Flavobacterium sp. NRK F10 TaxID=2954931 RepID=UPI002091D7BA|nr:OmpA family protein [Flavobacterium sp. NRK F10]MCO6176468.1 OmpA family protein [Flavobacterium sp. NRK F10]